jgi:Zn finger protein HypA/HybF involved in hydrogenase expression
VGSLSKFTCRSCGYEVEVSGGRDCGFQSVTMSILCDKCKEIFDVQIGEVTEDDDTIDRHAKEATCPECHSHDIMEWKKKI